MGISGRHGMLLFTGGVDIAFGMIFIVLGRDATISHNHGAVGVPMWSGIGLIMVGLGLIITVLTSKKKRMRDAGLNINLGSLVLNLTGMILAAAIIGFFTWGAWSVLSAGISGNPASLQDKLISIYTAVILMAIIVLLISLMAMFMDCCSFALFGGGPGEYYGAPRQRYYDGPYGPPPAHIYNYKQ